MSDEISLTPAELLSLEESDHKRKLKDLAASGHQMKVALAKTQQTLISANYTLKNREVEDLNRDAITIKKELIESERAHQNLVATLREKYDLPKGKWGYDPLTGLIKI